MIFPLSRKWDSLCQGKGGDARIAGKRVREAPGAEELGRWGVEKAGMGVPQCLGKRGVWELGDPGRNGKSGSGGSRC